MSKIIGDKPTVAIDPEILEIQKYLYKRQLLRQAYAKAGSKYYPLNVETNANERERLSVPMTAEQRERRKQWLKDQYLSQKEPVKVPKLEQVNIFRRIYRKPFDSITALVNPILGPSRSKTFRYIFPKVTSSIALCWVMWYHLKYNSRKWDDSLRGFRFEQIEKSPVYPGQEGFGQHVEKTDFGMEEFQNRKAFLNEKLITSTV